MDGILGVLPDTGIFESVTIYFKDNVRVTIKLVDVGKISADYLNNLPLEYVPDSAYLIDENGLIKIPDDSKESQEPFSATISGNNQEAFENHLGIYGFSFNMGSNGGTGSSGFLSCSVTKREVGTNDDGDTVYSFTYRCIRG